MTSQIKNLKNKCCYGNDRCPTCIGKHKFNDWNVCDYCQCHLGIDCEDLCKKNNQIKNFIEESDKQFDKWFRETKLTCWTSDSKAWMRNFTGETLPERNDIKEFIKVRQISLIKMIMQMVESEKKEYTPTYPNPVYYQDALAKNCNDTLDTISSKLKSLTSEN